MKYGKGRSVAIGYGTAIRNNLFVTSYGKSNLISVSYRYINGIYKMRFLQMSHGTCLTGVVFFILLFGGTEPKTWKDYDLFVGPVQGKESGKYVYNASVGGREHCRYCEERALRDSTYSFQQQPLCIKKYKGKEIKDAVLPQERNETKYPLCNRGEVPGCGPPPDDHKTKNHRWYCDPGFSLKNYSVYFSCALVCERKDYVDWRYYCNETLQWQPDRTEPWQSCEEPLEAEPETPRGLDIGLPVGAVVIVIVAVSVILYCCCYRKRKLKHPQIVEVPDVEKINRNIASGNRRENDIVGEKEHLQMMEMGERQVNRSIGSSHSGSNITSVTASIETEPSVEAQPLLPILPDDDGGENSDFQPIKRDITSGTDAGDTDKLFKPKQNNTDRKSVEHDERNGSDPIGAVGGPSQQNVSENIAEQNEKNRAIQTKDQPGISIFLNDSDKKRKSIPLQGGYYSIMKGSNFAVLPRTSGGVSVIFFEIGRIGDGRPFRGVKEMGFLNTVHGARKDDAGMFSWKIRLENDHDFNGSFEICIILPEVPERPQTIGEEASQTTRVGNIPQNNPPQHLNLPLQNAPSLSLSMFSQDSGVRSESRHSSGRINRHNNSYGGVNGHNCNGGINDSNSYGSDRQNNNVPFNSDSHSLVAPGHGVRPEHLRSGTSGYMSQNSGDIAREQFDAIVQGVPSLNADSFDTNNSSENNSRISECRLGENSLARIPEDVYPTARNLEEIHESEEENDHYREDPVGLPADFPHSESNDINHQTRRKEFIDSGPQQQEPEPVDDDNDDDCERLNCDAIEKDMSTVHEGDGCRERNEIINPRAEIQEPLRNTELEQEQVDEHELDQTSLNDDEIKEVKHYVRSGS